MTVESLLQQPLIWSLALLAIGFISAMIGGAVSGFVIAGKELGAEVATQMGALFGLFSGFPGIAVALVTLALVG